MRRLRGTAIIGHAHRCRHVLRPLRGPPHRHDHRLACATRPPEPLVITGPDGRRHTLRYRIWRAPTGISVDLVEDRRDGTRAMSSGCSARTTPTSTSRWSIRYRPRAAEGADLDQRPRGRSTRANAAAEQTEARHHRWIEALLGGWRPRRWAAFAARASRTDRRNETPRRSQW